MMMSYTLNIYQIVMNAVMMTTRMMVFQQYEQYDDIDTSNLSTDLFSEVVPAGVGVMVGDEGGDRAEDDGDDEEGEKDPETDSFAAVRFLREES